MAGIDTKEVWSWPDSPSISLDEVIAEKERGLLENKEPYGDTWKHPVKVERNKEYHMSRIIYFMNHPEKISGIEVDNPCFDNGILPGCVIIDGWHRIAAGILMKMKIVSIEYSGRSDVEDYIIGKTNDRPEEILFC